MFPVTVYQRRWCNATIMLCSIPHTHHLHCFSTTQILYFWARFSTHFKSASSFQTHSSYGHTLRAHQVDYLQEYSSLPFHPSVLLLFCNKSITEIIRNEPSDHPYPVKTVLTGLSSPTLQPRSREWRLECII